MDAMLLLRISLCTTQPGESRPQLLGPRQSYILWLIDSQATIWLNSRDSLNCINPHARAAGATTMGISPLGGP